MRIVCVFELLCVFVYVFPVSVRMFMIVFVFWCVIAFFFCVVCCVYVCVYEFVGCFCMSV